MTPSGYDTESYLKASNSPEVTSEPPILQKLREIGKGLSGSPGTPYGEAMNHLIAVVRSIYGDSYENELNNVKMDRELDYPGVYSVIDQVSIPARNKAIQDQMLATGTGMSGGIKGGGKPPPLSPELQSAFHLPEGGVVQTGPFHDISKLPEPYNAGENLQRLLAGYADDTHFFTKGQAEAAGRGEPLVPPAANERMPRNTPPPEGTRIIGKLNEFEGTHFGPDWTNPKSFPRPETDVGPMPESGLPDDVLDDMRPVDWLDRELDRIFPKGPSLINMSYELKGSPPPGIDPAILQRNNLNPAIWRYVEGANQPMLK